MPFELTRSAAPLALLFAAALLLSVTGCGPRGDAPEPGDTPSEPEAAAPEAAEPDPRQILYYAAPDAATAVIVAPSARAAFTEPFDVAALWLGQSAAPEWIEAMFGPHASLESAFASYGIDGEAPAALYVRLPNNGDAARAEAALVMECSDATAFARAADADEGPAALPDDLAYLMQGPWLLMGAPAEWVEAVADGLAAPSEDASLAMFPEEGLWLADIDGPGITNSGAVSAPWRWMITQLLGPFDPSAGRGEPFLMQFQDSAPASLTVYRPPAPGAETDAARADLPANSLTLFPAAAPELWHAMAGAVLGPVNDGATRRLAREMLRHVTGPANLAIEEGMHGPELLLTVAVSDAEAMLNRMRWLFPPYGGGGAPADPEVQAFDAGFPLYVAAEDGVIYLGLSEALVMDAREAGTRPFGRPGGRMDVDQAFQALAMHAPATDDEGGWLHRLAGWASRIDGVVAELNPESGERYVNVQLRPREEWTVSEAVDADADDLP